MTSREASTGGTGSESLHEGPYVHSRHVGVDDAVSLWIAKGLASTDERFGHWESTRTPDPELVGEAPPEVTQDPGPTVCVLGPVEVCGWRGIPERAVVVELACFLALHQGRSFSGDELRFALRPNGEAEISAKSLRTYMSLLRNALGSDHVPSGKASGYSISENVVSDWARFEALSAEEGTVRGLMAALRLVRGRPFAGVAAGTYEWAYSELLVAEMEARIAAATKDAVKCSFVGSQFNDALAAARRGLLGVPGDIELWEWYLATARATGVRAWIAALKEASAVFGEESELLGLDATRGLSDAELNVMWNETPHFQGELPEPDGAASS